MFNVAKALRYHLSKVIITIITLSVFLLTTCIDGEKKKEEPVAIQSRISHDMFAGSATCQGCHKDIYDKHLLTAHFLTSRIANEQSVMGSFEAGKNLHLYGSNVAVVMEKRDSGLFQVEYVDGVQKEIRRFDITIGSGTMGQSFLTWHNQQLFQLPITFFTAANRWSNSPGFANRPTFNRMITSRCMECHSTYAKVISPPGVEPEKFSPEKMIYGVDCEKCHGPAAEHVKFQTENPSDTSGKHIVNPAKLTRQQNLDLCALCHGGRLQKTTPSFEFIAGENLQDHFKLDTTVPNPQQVDVHGNQYGLLRASKCFRMSQTLTCNTCHNTHENEKNKTALFSQRCQSCHSTEHNTFCKNKELPKSTLIKNCIDCHMPQQPSKAISVFVSGQQTPIAAMIRSHYIAVYKDSMR
jgi:hypothetical protein